MPLNHDPMRDERMVRSASALDDAGSAGGMHDAAGGVTPRRRNADCVRAAAAGLSSALPAYRVLLTILVVVAASIVLTLGYSSFLSQMGVITSVPVLLAVLLASTLSSIAGFAFSAICGVMLLQMMSDPLQVVEIMMVCSIAIQSLSVAMLRNDIDWRDLLMFLAGGVVGLPFGVGLLLHLGQFGFKEAIGALLTAYAAYVLLKRPLTITLRSNVADAAIGFLGGITGGLAGFPGATVTIWCGMMGWDKRRQRGVYQPFILIMQILALILIQFLHKPARGHALGFEPLEFVPAALLGTWFGLAIFRRMSDRLFALAVNLLLLASGIGLLI